MSVLYIFPGTRRASRVSDTSAKPPGQPHFDGLGESSAINPELTNVPNALSNDQWVRRFPPFRVRGLSAAEAREHWPKLLAAQAHAAQGAHYLPHSSPRHYGAMVVLDNGIRAFGTNVEASRQLALCDLRLALGTALNQWLSNSSLKKNLPDQNGSTPFHKPLLQASSSKLSPNFPTVKTVYLANADLAGENPTPCAECQDWLNSKYFKPDTKVISLEKSADSPIPLVRQRTVRDILPLHKTRQPTQFTTELPLSKLSPVVSPLAARVIPAVSVKKRAQTVRRWMKVAQTAYQGNHLAPKNRTGVAVVVAPSGKIYPGSRMEWSSRWFEAADLKTASTALAAEMSLWQKVKHWFAERPIFQIVQSLWQKIQTLCGVPVGPESPRLPTLKNRIAAIAYYGDDRDLPPIASLGRMVRNGASANTLIVTVENDVLHLRTIRDFMPELYRPGE